MTRVPLSEDYRQAIAAFSHQDLSPEDLWQVGVPANTRMKVINPSAALTLRLGRDFSAVTPDGAEIRLSQKKGRLMLAMLACAPGQRRSRDWLRRTLWHRAFTAHGFSSLRQCLHNLRKALGAQGVCLKADRDHIWLEDVSVEWGECKDVPALFLEDGPRVDGPVAEWIERERRRLELAKAHQSV